MSLSQSGIANKQLKTLNLDVVNMKQAYDMVKHLLYCCYRILKIDNDYIMYM